MKPATINPLDLINIKDVLGCLYYVLLKEIKVIIDRIELKYCVESKIIEINKDKDSVKLSTEEGVYFKNNERIKVSCEINSMRYSFTTTVYSVDQEGEIIIKIPSVINHDEHRILPRFYPPEAMCDCLELVTGFFSGGIRIKGKVEDISLGGLGFIPSNIESIKDSNEVDLSDTKIRTGNQFKKLKFELNKNTLSIPIEICHTPTDERNVLGIKFNLNKSSKHCNKLKEFIETCAPQTRMINFASFYDEIKSKIES